MPRVRQRHFGFTLVEILIATTIAGLVMVGVLTTNFQLLRSGVRITQYAEMEAQVRRGLDQFSYDARTATGIKWNSPTNLTLTVPASGGTSRTVTYAWNVADETFYYVPGADATVAAGRTILVRGIPSAAFSFARFDRNGNVATTDLETKRVQVNLAVRRKSSVGAAASENGISATFTMRNKPVK